jgi:hypothetical protein
MDNDGSLPKRTAWATIAARGRRKIWWWLRARGEGIPRSNAQPTNTVLALVTAVTPATSRAIRRAPVPRILTTAQILKVRVPGAVRGLVVGAIACPANARVPCRAAGGIAARAWIVLLRAAVIIYAGARGGAVGDKLGVCQVETSPTEARFWASAATGVAFVGLEL